MRLIFLTMALILHFLSGCATVASTTGTDFNSAAIPQIQKGVTTTSQILQWFGEPYYKKAVSATDIIWLYSWSRQAVDPTVVPFGHRSIGNAGYRKILWILIRNDVVVNYAYEEKIL